MTFAKKQMVPVTKSLAEYEIRSIGVLSGPNRRIEPYKGSILHMFLLLCFQNRALILSVKQPDRLLPKSRIVENHTPGHSARRANLEPIQLSSYFFKTIVNCLFVSVSTKVFSMGIFVVFPRNCFT